jgi:hypothetical protein
LIPRCPPRLAVVCRLRQDTAKHAPRKGPTDLSHIRRRQLAKSNTWRRAGDLVLSQKYANASLVFLSSEERTRAKVMPVKLHGVDSDNISVPHADGHMTPSWRRDYCTMVSSILWDRSAQSCRRPSSANSRRISRRRARRLWDRRQALKTPCGDRGVGPRAFVG